MIIGFVGTPGSGKSYEAVKKVLDNIRLGRKIYTNIEGLDEPSCREAIKSYCNITDYQLGVVLNFLTNEQALEFWDHCEDGSLILIDEVHKLFSNRDWASEKNKQFTEWASTHRHNGFDVVLITQDIEKIDKHARSLIEWCYLFRKVNFLGGAVQKKYICYAYPGDDHQGQPLQKNMRHYDKRVFACYQSYVASDIKELGFMTHVNILKHPIFYAIPCVLLLFGFLFFKKSSFASGDIFGTSKTLNQAQVRIEENAKESNVSVLPFSSSGSSVVVAGQEVIEGSVREYEKVPTVSHKNYTESFTTLQIVTYKLQDGRLFHTNVRNNQPQGAVLFSPGFDGHAWPDAQEKKETDI